MDSWQSGRHVRVLLHYNTNKPPAIFLFPPILSCISLSGSFHAQKMARSPVLLPTDYWPYVDVRAIFQAQRFNGTCFTRIRISCHQTCCKTHHFTSVFNDHSKICCSEFRLMVSDCWHIPVTSLPPGGPDKGERNINYIYVSKHTTSPTLKLNIQNIFLFCTILRRKKNLIYYLRFIKHAPH